MQRILGRSNLEVSALGMGCWAIGGQFRFGDMEAGWGAVDDAESIKAIHAAIAGGINFFDTAAAYGAGYSERILGKAIAKQRDKVVFATKFGYKLFEAEKRVDGVEAMSHHIQAACDAALKRLETDYIDLFQFHVGDYPLEQVGEVLQTLENLVTVGKIRAYGWSTDDVARAAAFAAGTHCVAIQHDMNLMMPKPEMLALCEAQNLASINRGPLAMGLLTGKFAVGQQLAKDDIRGVSPDWMQYFRDGKPNPDWLRRLEAVREILTSKGRSLTQGALAWLWGYHQKTIPIPGIRTVAQAEENAAAMQFGALEQGQVEEIARILHDLK
jgi:aryl-alcohol dehydrogenase-like predicted oxidoreductase